MLPTLQILQGLTFTAGSKAAATAAGQDLPSQLSATQVAAAEFIQALVTLAGYLQPNDPAKETLMQIINVTIETALFDFTFPSQSGLVGLLPGFN